MRKSGVSKYPIEVGHVIKLIEPRLMYNDNFLANRKSKSYSRTVKRRSRGIRVAHTVYIWIQAKSTLLSGKQEKFRNYLIHTVYVPNLNGMSDRYLKSFSKVEKLTIAKAMKISGYEIIAEGLPFDRKETEYKIFFKAIGVM